MSATEFVECATCASKPGSPELCSSCQRNRAALQRLANLDKAATDARLFIEALSRPFVFDSFRGEVRPADTQEVAKLVDKLKAASRTVHASPFWGDNAPVALAKRCMEDYRRLTGRGPAPLTLRLPGHYPVKVRNDSYPDDPPAEVIVTPDEVSLAMQSPAAPLSLYESLLADKVASAARLATDARRLYETVCWPVEHDVQGALEAVCVVCPQCRMPVSNPAPIEGPQPFSHCGKRWMGVFYRRQTS